MGIYEALSNSWARFKTWVRETRLWAAVSFWRRRRAPENDFTHRLPSQVYPGSRRREYVVHQPRGKTDKRARPLVVVLHGCRQDHRDIEQITGFNELADRHDFLVAYPNITSYSGLRDRNCWGWWFAREIRAGAGEVEDLGQIVEDIKRHYAVDERRIHVTGLSAGGGYGGGDAGRARGQDRVGRGGRGAAVRGDGQRGAACAQQQASLPAGGRHR